MTRMTKGQKDYMERLRDPRWQRVRLRVLEVVCTDAGIHRQRLEKRERLLPHLDETTWRAVEQSLEGYAPWTGPSTALPRVTLDSVQPLGANVEAALAFIAA